MSIAAVPNYLQQIDPGFYLSAPPGHRFLLYFPCWGENGETGGIDWRTKDRVRKFKRRQGQLVDDGWTDIENSQFACTIAACKSPQYDEEKPRARKPTADPGLKPWKPLMDGLLKRQEAAASQIAGGALFHLSALAIAPFTTGLGNEHPLENGFAFLNPYGLPYLPGSGVKGVLRQAARELASGEWGDSCGWSTGKRFSHPTPARGSGTRGEGLSVIDVLFGLESGDGDTVHLRGALSIWDVIPQITSDNLLVEIMTPHQKHYYQDGQYPHESGQPTPISFLTVPPGSRFVFHVQCDLAHLERLAPELTQDGRWKGLVEAAFAHAFDWLGFGAKTAVGYGTMVAPEETRPSLGLAGPQTPDTAGQSSLTQSTTERWQGVLLKLNSGNGELSVTHQGSSARVARPDSDRLRQKMTAERQARLAKKKELGGCTVDVEKVGNAWRIVDILNG